MWVDVVPVGSPASRIAVSYKVVPWIDDVDAIGKNELHRVGLESSPYQVA